MHPNAYVANLHAMGSWKRQRPNTIAHTISWAGWKYLLVWNMSCTVHVRRAMQRITVPSKKRDGSRGCNEDFLRCWSLLSKGEPQVKQPNQICPHQYTNIRTQRSREVRHSRIESLSASRQCFMKNNSVNYNNIKLWINRFPWVGRRL